MDVNRLTDGISSQCSRLILLTCISWPFLAAIKTLRAIYIAIDIADNVIYRNPLFIFQMARADKFSQVARKREFLPEQKAQQTQLLNRNRKRKWSKK